ncbi:MAG: MarR family transcriptional regulator [Solirubrobacterales bacterium]
MSETVDAVRRLLVERLDAIEAERTKLERALQEMSGGRPRVRMRGAGRGRARRGQRRAELLDALRVDPGARPAALAARMGISGSQVSGLLARAQADGLVVKRGRGYELKV